MWEKNCYLGSLGFLAGSLAVLTCTEPGARGGGKRICRYKSLQRQANLGERIHSGRTGCLWSAREVCFPDIWRTFPGIGAVFTMRLGRVSGEELS